MSLTLYRKYRPGTFGEIEGQEHVVRTLQGALRAGRVGHAYLFAGPRGTGKTTVARLFAKALNCSQLNERLLAEGRELMAAPAEPCNLCSSCGEINEGRSLDLIEIDAASNRGIDEIRNLRDSARVAAASSNYKVFVIDEVHALTKDAFNALLKTLEEPPAHVVFVLATTEPHKVLETILSRVQRFDFRKISPGLIVKKLKKVAAAEKIEIDDEALAALASHAGGSLRDAESALAKLVAFAGEKITADHAAEILGLVPIQVHENFLKAILEKRPQEAMTLIAELYDSGADLENFTKQFVNHTRAKLVSIVGKPIADSSLSPQDLVKILNVFVKTKSEFRGSPIPQLPLELAVMELTSNGQS